MQTKFAIVNVKDVQPDENQPRKYFNAEKLHQLKSSIKKEGIISPLVVEKVGDKYILTDGERRYRAAIELGLKEVPVMVEPAGNKVTRLTRQFTVQEQHENWTPTEKASALINLSNEIGVSLLETCKLLNVSNSDARRYIAFSQLADRDNWVRNEVPMDYAQAMSSLNNITRRIKEETMGEEFTKQDAKRLERRVIESIKEGDISRRVDVTRLKDSFVKNPKSIEQYITDKKATPTSLFLGTKAQGAYALRNAIMNAGYVRSHGNKFLENPDVKLEQRQVNELKMAKEVINKLLALYE